MAVTEESILAGVVTLENQYTRLLTNLMRQDPPFRERVLELFTKASRGTTPTIETQRRLYDNEGFLYGQPDMLIRLAKSILLIEVKIKADCPFTPKETPHFKSKNNYSESPRGYYAYVRDVEPGEVRYILPAGYQLDPELGIDSSQIIEWHEIVRLIEPNNEFHFWIKNTLEKRFSPASFTYGGIGQMNNTNFPLDHMLDLLAVTQELRNKAFDTFGKGKVDSWLLNKVECGFYINRGNFWVGVFPGFWQADGRQEKPVGGPLLFGPHLTSDGNAAGLFRSVLQIRLNQEAIEHGDYLYGWFPSARELTASSAWDVIHPIVKATFQW